MDRTRLLALLTRIGSRIWATEVVVFHLVPRGNARRLQVTLHIRLNGSGEGSSDAVITALREIVNPYVQSRQEWAVVELPAEPAQTTLRDTQYCLIAVASRHGEVSGAYAFVVRRRDQREAQAALDRLRGEFHDARVADEVDLLLTGRFTNAQFWLERAAVAVGATEAAALAWSVSGGDGTRRLEPVVHLRPGESSDAERARAIDAFRELILPCIEAGKDGVVEVSDDDGQGRQFCLIALPRRKDLNMGVLAFIVRCAENVQARNQLRRVREVLSDASRF